MTDSRPRILYLFPGTMEPPTCGMRQRNKLLYRALCKIGDVDTICLREQHEWVSDEAIAEMRETIRLIDVFDLPERGARGPWSMIRPLSPNKVDRLARALGCPDVENHAVPQLRDRLRGHVRQRGHDLVVCRYFYRAAKAGVLDVHPHVIDIDDLQTELLRTTLENGRGSGVAGMLQRRRLRRLAARLPARFSAADRLFVANDEHCREPGLENAVYLPNIPYFEEGDTPPPPPPLDPTSKRVLFVGSFGHPPNRDGVEHFLANVWPRVHQAAPKAVLMLVGSKMSDAMKRRYAAIPGVEPIGFVDQLRDAYARCAFTVVPIYRGSGTNIKVPESLAYGRATVVTPFALRGYRSVLAENQHVILAESDDAFARHTINLLAQPDRSSQLAANGRQAVDRCYSFRGFAEVIQKSVGHAAAFQAEHGPQRVAI